MSCVSKRLWRHHHQISCRVYGRRQILSGVSQGWYTLVLDLDLTFLAWQQIFQWSSKNCSLLQRIFQGAWGFLRDGVRFRSQCIPVISMSTTLCALTWPQKEGLRTEILFLFSFSVFLHRIIQPYGNPILNSMNQLSLVKEFSIWGQILWKHFAGCEATAALFSDTLIPAALVLWVPENYQTGRTHAIDRK